MSEGFNNKFHYNSRLLFYCNLGFSISVGTHILISVSLSTYRMHMITFFCDTEFIVGVEELRGEPESGEDGQTVWSRGTRSTTDGNYSCK